MVNTYKDIKFKKFWDNNAYSKKEYIGGKVTEKMVKDAQKMYRYRLPTSYIALLKIQNGGMVKFTCHKAAKNSWAEDHVGITGIYGIDPKKECSIAGFFKSSFWMAEWGYPDIGIYIADCPSAGHDMICMDYSECGEDGEPRIVHVDQERDNKITHLASSFDEFIHGLYADNND